MTRPGSEDDHDWHGVPEQLRKAAEPLRTAIERRDPAALLEAIRAFLATQEPLAGIGLANACHQQGLVTYQRGSYDWSYVWHQLALMLFTEVRDRAGMAISYHSMGLAAEQLEEYDKADDDYGRSCTLYSELGDQAGLVANVTHRAIVDTKRGNPEQGVSGNVMALAARLAHGLPDASLDIQWLNRQRTMLGEDRFSGLLRGRIGEAGARNLLRLLDQHRSSG
jgi:hypothetical protein